MTVLIIGFPSIALSHKEADRHPMPQPPEAGIRGLRAQHVQHLCRHWRVAMFFDTPKQDLQKTRRKLTGMDVHGGKELFTKSPEPMLRALTSTIPFSASFVGFQLERQAL